MAEVERNIAARLGEAEATLVAHARVARMSTIAPDGSIHAVPICPALDGDGVLIATAAQSAKVRNLAADPRVTLVFDDYVEDWEALRSVMIQGTGTVVEDGTLWERGRALLYEKFRQYEQVVPIEPGSTVIVKVAIDRVVAEGFTS